MCEHEPDTEPDVPALLRRRRLRTSLKHIAAIFGVLGLLRFLVG